MPSMIMIPREAFLRAPARVVKVFLGCAKIANELNIATKYYRFARNSLFCETSQNPSEGVAARSVLYHRLVMLAGHTHECHRFLNTSPARKLISENDIDLLDGFTQTFSYIDAFFSSKNLITVLRDKVSFHTDTGILFSLIESASADYAFSILNGEVIGHIVFSGSDLLVETLLNETPASSAIPYDENYSSAPDQIHQVSDYMGIILQQMLGYIAHRYLNVDFSDSFELPPVALSPNINTVRLPFFCTG